MCRNSGYSESQEQVETLVHAIDLEARVLGEVFIISRSARSKRRTEIGLGVEYLPPLIEILKRNADLNILSSYIKMIFRIQ